MPESQKSKGFPQYTDADACLFERQNHIILPFTLSFSSSSPGPPPAKSQFCIFQYMHSRLLARKQKQLHFAYTCAYYTCRDIQILDLLTKK